MKSHYGVFLSLAIGAGFATSSACAASGALPLLNSGAEAAANPPASGSAKAMTNRLATPDASRAQAQPAVGGGAPGSSVASPATSPIASPRAFGSFGIPYTSTRVQAGASTYQSTLGLSYLSTTAPYNRVGKLFFMNSNGMSYCTASLIRKSVIVTAAHCVQSFGSGNSTYSGWMFVPGVFGGAVGGAPQFEPYGRFSWRAISRAASWADGTDTGSGSARNNDLAVIVLGKNDKGQFIGDVLGGWLPYAWNNYSFISSPKTGNVAVAATTTLGYPYILDDGAIMQRTDGPSFLTTIGGALQMWQGSNFTDGSSGGPWIVNFTSRKPKLSGGAVPGTAHIIAVIGVTSWGSADPNDIKDNYASRFGQNTEFPNPDYGGYGAGNIGALLLNACKQLVSPGVTYALAGYCKN